MTQASCDPAWVSVVAALGPPIIALLVGVLGGLIAYRQWRTARNRLKLDLFDRRLTVYEQTRDLLARRMAAGFLDLDEIIEFRVKARVAQWLFDPAMAAYLEEIGEKTRQITAVEMELKQALDEARRKQLISQQRVQKEWLDKQLYEVLDAKFGKFLHLEH